ncbi:MAG: carbonate dehydratase [Verrucomicrobia bacterium]|nr:MAG: carbonate dehydratase [Verrucomicrobiota bacterium]
MEESFKKILKGYQLFRKKYAKGDESVMHYLSQHGQKPNIMVVACCDSRVDPALILQCDPGDLFVVRNVANIIPPYEKDEMHHGTSAALEFGVCFLKVKHLILLGHSQCSGVRALLDEQSLGQNDFITNWVSLIKKDSCNCSNVDDYAKIALQLSYQNLMTFPWIKQNMKNEDLIIHLWFFDIKSGQIFTYLASEKTYKALDSFGTR